MIDLRQNDGAVGHAPNCDSPRRLTLVVETTPIFHTVAEARKALTSGATTEQRVAAVWCMASSDDEFTDATLVAALFDTEEEVRRAAAQVLSQSRNPDFPTASIENLVAQENERHERNSWNLAIDDLNSPYPKVRISALSTIGNLKRENAFNLITEGFDDECADVRAAAILVLYEFDRGRATELFTQALDVASAARRLRIVEAIQMSALGSRLIEDLTSEDRQQARAALSLLLLMAKMNVVRPLIEAIEQHETAEVRRALIRILNLTGQSNLAEAAAKRRLGIVPQPTLVL